MSNSRDIADSAATINFIDGLTSNAQTQIDGKAVYPTQTGNAGKFLSTDGTTTNWGEVAASPSVDATTSGAISNGDLVAINPDGTVSNVEELTASLATSGVIESQYNRGINFGYDSINNKILAILNNNSNPESAVVGTISGDSITWGTPVTFTGGLTVDCEIAFDTTSGKFIFFFNNSLNGNYQTAQTGTISGTTITFGTPVVVESAYSDLQVKGSVVYDPSTNKIVFIFSNNTAMYSRIATVSGTSLSLQTRYTVYTTSTSLLKAVYVPATQSIAVIHVDNNYRDTMGFNAKLSASSIQWIPQKQVRLIWGSSFAVAGLSQGNSPNSTYVPSIAAHPTEPHIFWSYRGVYNDTFYLYSFSLSEYFGIQKRNVFISGIGTETSGCLYNEIAYDENSERIIVARQGNTASDAFVQEYVEDFELGFKLVNTTEITDESPARNVVACIYIPSEQKSVIGYAKVTTNYPVAAVYTSGISSANKYIGISDADYTDGATAKIQLVGSVDDAQSGLTAGKTHYVQRDGTLSTAPDNPKVVAGTAMSSTSIIVKG